MLPRYFLKYFFILSMLEWHLIFTSAHSTAKEEPVLNTGSFKSRQLGHVTAFTYANVSLRFFYFKKLRWTTSHTENSKLKANELDKCDIYSSAWFSVNSAFFNLILNYIITDNRISVDANNSSRVFCVDYIH